jgi:hypothetical protein
MKIMVYYLGIDIVGPTRDQRAMAAHQAQLKLQELQKEFPTLKIKVIPIYDTASDHIDVVDMTPPVYPPYYQQQQGVYGGPYINYPNPNPTAPPNPYTVIGTYGTTSMPPLSTAPTTMMGKTTTK